MHKINLMTIGGSNSVINGGYLDHFIKAINSFNIVINLNHNLAVGNTTSGFGLYQLKKHSEFLINTNVLIIEYALNDEFIYSLHPWDTRHWSRLYEGIMRYAKEINPNILIFSIILSTRNGDYTHKVPPIAACINYLSKWYDCECIDINMLLTKQLGADTVRSENFYMPKDSAHYNNPDTTSLIGKASAEYLIKKLNKNKSANFNNQTPVDPENYANCNKFLLTESVDETLVKHEVLLYENSKFRASAIDISNFELLIKIENGKLLGIEYVCERETAPIYLQYNEKKFRVGTMKMGVQNETYEFLTSWLPLEFAHTTNLLSNSEKINEYKLHTNETKNEKNLQYFTPRDGVQLNDEIITPEKKFAAIGFLYSGKLLSVELKKIES